MRAILSRAGGLFVLASSVPDPLASLRLHPFAHMHPRTPAAHCDTAAPTLRSVRRSTNACVGKPVRACRDLAYVPASDLFA